MSTSRRSMLCTVAMLLCFSAATLSAQSATLPASQCFSIHVSLNGKPLDGPQEITLKTKQGEIKASLEQDCFKVPPALLAEKTLDISFTIPGNQIDILIISTGFFTGSWDVELEDKKFGNAVALPKHFRAKKGCVVVFHMGDEPERGLSVMPCRTPVPTTTKKPVAQDTDSIGPATGNLHLTIPLVATTKQNH